MLKTKFLDYLKQVLLSDAFEDFMCCSTLDKTVFCLGEKQGVNDDCSSWYNRVGDFLMSIYGRERRKFYMAKDQYIRFLRTSPLLSARPMVIIAMVVE